MEPVAKRATRKAAMKVAVEDREKVNEKQYVPHDCFFVDATLDRILVYLERTYYGKFEIFRETNETVRNLLGGEIFREILVQASAFVGTRVSIDLLLERRRLVLERREILERLIENPGIAQRTPEWYDARQGLITASDAAQALGCAKFGNQRQFFQKKAGLPEEQAPFDGSVPPLKWGVMLEPVAQAIYSAVNADVKVHEFGLLRHPTLDFIGASPDGITDTGIMVEIKCPYRRKIVPGEVPTQYYYQIQGQLAVCGLDQCDFWEVEIEETFGPDDPDWIAAEAEGGAAYGRGLVLETGTEKAPEFVYPDPVVGLPREALVAWAIETKVEGQRWIEHWWYVRRRGTTRVKYDEAFCEDMFARLGQVWQRVLEYRTDRSRYLVEVGASSTMTSASDTVMVPVPLPAGPPSPKFSGYAFIDE